MNMPINVYDNFFTKEEHNFISDYCSKASYFYGEGDSGLGEPFNPNYCTGLVHEVYYFTEDTPLLDESRLIGGDPTKVINQKKMFDLFSSSIETRFPQYKSKDITRMYINCFAALEKSYFHTDGDVGTTFLYYPNETWDLDDGGETKFFIDGGFYGIPPIPNRLISFDASIEHTATPFRNRHRFSIAIKYGIYFYHEDCK
jgi:hypothetical protein